jgi:ATP-dependent DNA helicase RecG
MIETDNIEFKREWRDEFLRVICAFANTNGGIIYIGKDDDGNDIGIDDYKELLEMLPNKINSKIGIIPEIRISKSNKKKVLEIRVNTSSVPVSFNGKFYFRSGSVVVELQGKKLSDFLLRKSGNTWDNISIDVGTNPEIDSNTIQLFKRYAIDRLPSINSEKNDRAIIEKLNLVDSHKLKRAAIILFGKNTQKYFPQAHTRIGRFLSESEIIASDIVEGNLFQQLENSIDILRKKYLLNLFHFEGIHRREKSVYPVEALREALLNALIHRDYTSTASTQIRVYDDKLLIMNAGELPDELTIEDLKKHHLSIPRNALLADVFYKAGFIEIWGSGTLKIIEACKMNRMAEPVFNQGKGIFEITFFMNKDLITAGKDVGQGFKGSVKAVYDFIKADPQITIPSIVENTGLSESTIARKIAELKKMKLVLRIGGRKEGYWRVSEVKNSDSIPDMKDDMKDDKKDDKKD